ncbi:hypothetical protein MTY414_75730 [Mycolicibacterium mageritense]|nr:hypothetical protein MTY414_75730 [Mycolicibacterium mageritense]
MERGLVSVLSRVATDIGRVESKIEGPANKPVLVWIRVSPELRSTHSENMLIALIEDAQVCSLKFLTCEQRSVYCLAVSGGG